MVWYWRVLYNALFDGMVSHGMLLKCIIMDDMVLNGIYGIMVWFGITQYIMDIIWYWIVWYWKVWYGIIVLWILLYILFESMILYTMVLHGMITYLFIVYAYLGAIYSSCKVGRRGIRF